MSLSRALAKLGGTAGLATLCTALALAFAVRALGFEYVFVGDEIVFPPADAQYHLRRALYTMTTFPDVLLFDRYINHPGGAAVAWPPLFDFVLGALGRLGGGELRDLERVAAWSGPVCALLSIVAVHLAGLRLGSRRVAAIATFVFAWLPIGVVYTRVGNADHHAAVAMVGAWLLVAVLGLVDPTSSRRRTLAHALLLFAASTAMLLTWHGSLLYLAPVEAILLLAGIVTGRASMLVAQAFAVFASAAVVALFLALAPEPLGGPYSSIALSRLHLLSLAAAGTAAAGLVALMRAGRADTVAKRFTGALVLVTAFAALVFAWPGPRRGLLLALGFLTLGDEVGAITGEQTPLFAFGGRLHGPPASESYGWFAWLLPVAPLAGLLAGRGPGARPAARAAGLALCGFGLVFCSLAVLQRRYGNDAAPAASLGFALALVWAADRVLSWRAAAPDADASAAPARRRRLAAGALALALATLLLAPALAGVFLPRARASWRALDADASPNRLVQSSVAYTLHRFLGDVRAATPETSGYVDASAAPEYGVIAHANLGHALQYRARRATATDPFWWYIGRENWDRSFAFLAATSERDAVELAGALAARYVVTMPGLGDDTVVGRLHARDGLADGDVPALEHFRLVAEAEPGGLAIGALFEGAGARTRGIPYKLFEIVEGTRVEVTAAPGEQVVARVTVASPGGRRFRYVQAARAGDDGVARLRIPYATEGGAAAPQGARAVGALRVEAGARAVEVELPEASVRDGGVVRVDVGAKGAAGEPAPAPAPTTRS